MDLPEFPPFHKDTLKELKKNFDLIAGVGGLMKDETREETGRRILAETDYQNIKLEAAYRKGFKDGLREFAWWKDGVQYVGSCGKKLNDALQKFEEIPFSMKDYRDNVAEE